MAKRTKMTTKILAAHRVDDKTRRYAIQVNEGRDVARVVFVDVKTGDVTPDTNSDAAAAEKAMFPRIGVRGVTLLWSVYNDGVLTGLGEPMTEGRV